MECSGIWKSASSKSRTLTPIWKCPTRTLFSLSDFSASTRTSGWKAILKLTVSVTRSFLLHFNRTIGPSCIPWVKVTPIHPSLQSVSCDAVKRNLSNTVTYRILYINNIQYTDTIQSTHMMENTREAWYNLLNCTFSFWRFGLICPTTVMLAGFHERVSWWRSRLPWLPECRLLLGQAGCPNSPVRMTPLTDPD